MIAEIKTQNGLKATLEDDGTWQSENADFAKMLNRFFSPEMIPPSPAAGFSEFAAQAREAADSLGAKITWSLSESNLDPGVVF